MKKDEDDIKVNKRRTDKLYFESIVLQRISDTMDFLKAESKQVAEELDEQGIDEFELKEFANDTIYQLDDILDDVSRLKSQIINQEEVPEFIKESSKNAKIALNRDETYIRRAKRRLDKVESGELVDSYKSNVRVIELCDKTIELDKSNFDAYYLKGLALINLKEYDQGIDMLINALRVNNEDVRPWLAIANANRLNGDYDDAIDVYDRVLTLEENSYEALKGKGYAYFDCEDYEKCDEFFKKANAIKFLDEESKATWDACLEKLN